MTGNTHEPAMHEERPGGEEPPSGKKLYAKPRLSVHGTVEHITKGTDAGEQDMDGQGTSIGGEVQ